MLAPWLGLGPTKKSVPKSWVLTIYIEKNMAATIQPSSARDKRVFLETQRGLIKSLEAFICCTGLLRAGIYHSTNGQLEPTQNQTVCGFPSSDSAAIANLLVKRLIGSRGIDGFNWQKKLSIGTR